MPVVTSSIVLSWATGLASSLTSNYKLLLVFACESALFLRAKQWTDGPLY